MPTNTLDYNAIRRDPRFEGFRRDLLTQSGFDPDKFDVNLQDGTVIPRQQISPTTAVAANAAYSVPDALVGGGSAVLAMKYAPKFLPKPLGALATLAAPFVGHYLANKAGLQEAKQVVAPDVAKTVVAAQEQRPGWSTAGSLLGSMAGGMSPSTFVQPGRALAGTRSLVSGVPWRSLSEAQRSAIANIGIGTALGAAEPTVRKIAGDENVTANDILLGAGTGAWFSKPNAIGRAMGFHGAPASDSGAMVPTARERFAPTATEAMPEAWRALNERLGAAQGTEVQFKPTLTDTAGAPVRGYLDPGADPTIKALASISEKAGLHDTPPHELIHNIVNRLTLDGTPAEKAFLARAVEKYGSVENLVQAAGEEFSGRFQGRRESVIRDLGSLIRDRFLRRGTHSDYANIMANILQRQGALKEQPGRVFPTKSQLDVAEAKPATQATPPELDAALKSFGVAAPEGMNPVDELKAVLLMTPKTRAAAATKLEGAIQRQRALLEALPTEQRAAVEAEINRTEFTAKMLRLAERIPQKIQEMYLTPDKPPTFEEPLVEELKPIDTGERSHEETSFEGYQPPKQVVKEKPIKYGEWETRGSEPPPAEPEFIGRPITDANYKASGDAPIGAKPNVEARPTPNKDVPPVEPNTPAGKSIQTELDKPLPGAQELTDYASERQYQKVDEPTELQKAFNEVHNHQRWKGPEDMFGERANPGVQYTTGLWRWFMEHGGDLVHRSSYSGYKDFGGGGIEYGRSATLEKARKLLAYIKPQKGNMPIDQDVQEQLEHNYKSNVERAAFKGTKQEFDALMQTVGDRYATAYEAIQPVTEVQKLGRDIAIDIGRRKFLDSVPKLERLIKLLEADDWEQSYWKPLDESKYPNRQYQRFGPTDEQTKEVPKRTGLNPAAGEVTKLERAGPDHAELGKGFRKWYYEQRANLGRYFNPMVGALERLDKDAQQRIYETLIDERRAQRSLRGRLQTPEEEAAYDQIKATIKQMADDQIAAGQPVWTSAGTSRQRGVDPWYFPNIISGKVHRILSEGQGTQAFTDLKRDFINHQIRVGGVTAAEAEKRFAKMMGSFSTSVDSNPFDFQSVRQQQGYGLPDSWIESDPIRAIRSYTRRFSRDRAFWDTIETDPRLMRMLGSNRFKGDQTIPANVTGPNLVRDPQVQRIAEDFLSYEREDEPLVSGATRLISAALIGGPHTKVADMVTTPFKALGLVAKGHVGDVLKGILASPEGYKNAFKTGLNRRGGLVVASDILGFGEMLNTKMVQLAENITKYSGAEAMELASRGMAQSIGEYIGETHQRLASQGDAASIEFLNKLAADTNTPREELGTRIAQLLQGNYNASNLPHAVTHGKLAPFFGLLRWSVEQLNNFDRFAVQPAMKGDFRPVILSILGSMAGGEVINQLREALFGRPNFSPTWKELEEGKDKEGFKDALTYKLLSIAQTGAVAGILSELTKQSYEAATGRSPQGFNYPVANTVGDAALRALSGVRAIAGGEDAGAVINSVITDILKQNVQSFRLARTALGRAGLNEDAQKELEKSKENRDLTTWERMEGRPQSAPTKKPIDYTKIAEQKFDEAPAKEAATLVPTLVERAHQKAGNDVVQFSKNLDALRSTKPYGMPSPKSNPIDFANYYRWLVSIKGKDEADRLVREYVNRSAESDVKRSLIPTVKVR